MLKYTILLILVSFSSSVFAGGYHFEVLVEAFESNIENPNNFTAVLSPTAVKPYWPEEKCKKIIVVGEFDSERWKEYKRPMSPETHKESIQYISSSVGNNIYFGVMGHGLSETKKCHFQSKGLFLAPYAGKSAVYSVYGRI
jgi:hypothetical protein